MSGTANPPAPKPIDIDEIITGFRALQQFGTQALADTEAAFAGAEAATRAAAGAASAVGAAEVNVNTIIQESAIKTRAANASAAASFGTNPNDSSYVIHELGGKIRESILATEARREKVQADLDASFFDDPLAWLGAQVTLPLNQASLELHENRTTSLVKSLANLQNLTLEQGKINAAVNEASSTELLAAQNKLIMSRAAKEAAAAGAQLARLGIDKITMRRALTMDQFDSMIRANDVVMRVQNADMERTRLELAQNNEARAARNEVRQEKLFQLQIKAKEEDDAAKEELQKGINHASAILGFRPIGVREYLSMAEANPIKRSIDGFMFSQDAAFNRLGSNPAQALGRANSIPVQLPAAQEDTRQKLMQVQAAIVSQEAALWKSYTPDVREQKINEGMQDYVKKQQANIPSTGSIYSPPPLASVVNIPVFANNPVVEKLRALATNPNYPTNAEDVVLAGLAVIREQTPPGQKPDINLVNIIANNIAFIYQGIIVDNNTLRQYTKFALPGLDTELTGFKTSITSPGIGGTRTDVVNMASKEALAAYMLRRMPMEDARRQNFTPFLPPRGGAETIEERTRRIQDQERKKNTGER